ncbi:MAG: hypothetical protein FJ403_16160 [Verrucomicrobia bacterium]|nr:hypothetical protein [Verrucomicrobiota bacterium]
MFQKRSSTDLSTANCGRSGEEMISGPPSRGVGSMAIQPDGRILAAGSFTNAAGVSHSRLTRLRLREETANKL